MAIISKVIQWLLEKDQGPSEIGKQGNLMVFKNGTGTLWHLLAR